MIEDPAVAEEWRRNGTRIAFYRVIAGLSQQQLGEPLGYSQAYISQIENGRRRSDRRSMLAAFARVLGVSLNELTGEPVPVRTPDDMAASAAVRLTREALWQPTMQVEPRELAVLADDVDRIQRAWMHCDYHTLAQVLPGVLTDARTYYDVGDRHREQILGLLVRACVTGSLAVKALGHVDLGQLLADRARGAATELGDPVCIGAGWYATAQCALAAGAGEQSLILAAGAVDRLAEDGRAGDNEVEAWKTMLHLHSALSASFLHREDDAQEHLEEARRHVQHVSGDPWRMEASEENVKVWTVSIAVENGHPEQAPSLAGHVNPAGLRTPQRRGRLYMDKARGLLELGNHDAAVDALLRADEILPTDIRRRQVVKEMVSYMVRTAPGRGGGSMALQTLARRVGVGPETIAA